MSQSLFEAIVAPDNLRAAWNTVARKKSAPGIDGVSVSDFSRFVDDELRLMGRYLRNGRYHPWPLRGVFVPKGKGDWRACGTPTVRDRIAQRAFLNVVVPIVDARFYNGSHAYRPARSIHSAISQVERARERGKKWVLESDVEKCFESIDRMLALATLETQLRDDRALNLVTGWIENTIDWGAGPVQPTRGIAQGDLISPFVCNVFLDRFDAALVQQGFSPIRYADDFLIPLRSPNRAELGKEAATNALKDLGLQLSQRKTSLTSFGNGFTFLGTLFVGALTLPRHRYEKKGRVTYSSGYEERYCSSAVDKPLPPSPCHPRHEVLPFADRRSTKRTHSSKGSFLV